MQEIRLEGKGLVDIVQQDVEFFQSLKALRLENNRLSSCMALARLSSLARLHLSCNRIRHLPQLQPGEFESLQVLDLNFNFVRAKDIFASENGWSRLPALRELDLCGNDIAALPAALGSFPALRKLALDFNQLPTACLEPLSALPSLQELGLASNCISGLPSRLMKDPRSFASLTSLDLSNNAIRCTAALFPCMSAAALLALGSCMIGIVLPWFSQHCAYGTRLAIVGAACCVGWPGMMHMSVQVT